jgi:hypothetical protein
MCINILDKIDILQLRHFLMLVHLCDFLKKLKDLYLFKGKKNNKVNITPLQALY